MSLKIKRVLSLVLSVALLNTAACGYLIYPERQGQRGDRVDGTVVALDAVGLLFFILPGVRHSFAPVADYFFWVKADYFCRFLLEDTSYQTVDIPELNREKEHAGEKRR